MPKIIQKNYYGFNHEAVAKSFGGDLSYCNSFCVNGEYAPVAVYRAKNPDKSKGHKEYMLLQMKGENGIVRGMTRAEIRPFRKQEAVHCLECDEVIYSTNRHDYTSCSCKKTTIDGGKEYTKIGFTVGTFPIMVEIDLLTNKVTKIIDRKKK